MAAEQSFINEELFLFVIYEVFDDLHLFLKRFPNFRVKSLQILREGNETDLVRILDTVVEVPSNHLINLLILTAFRSWTLRPCLLAESVVQNQGKRSESTLQIECVFNHKHEGTETWSLSETIERELKEGLT